jgi:hypothetical protein
MAFAADALRSFPVFLAQSAPCDLDLPVIVAVLVVLVVEVSVDDVVDMVAMRDGIVPALAAVRVAALVRTTRVGRRAACRVRLSGFEDVFVNVPLMDVMQMSLVQVVLMSLVLDRLVPTGRPVSVVVLFMCLVLSHSRHPFRQEP